ncbi:MAG TPA: TIM barrel protein [bacterium]
MSRRFGFGLWTLMHAGADPFGRPTRNPLDALGAISGLAAHGVQAFELHAEDLIPPGSSAGERDRLIREAQRRMSDTGIACAACGSDVFSDPLFADGGMAASDPAVRGQAVARYAAAIDVGAELGAPLFNIWGGRDGVEVDAARSPLDALQWLRDGFNELSDHISRHGYAMRLSIEPKPNEPRGDLYLPTVGHALGFIATLARPDRIGVVLELAHAAMAGLNPAHEAAHALSAGKLFGIHLNAQRPLRFDQDLRFGSAGIKDAFFVVKVLEEARWDGVRSFDARPLRTTDERGIWDFVAGCIRAYEILAEKAAEFTRDPEVQAVLRELEQTNGPRRTFLYERLDHLVFEILTGMR